MPLTEPVLPLASAPLTVRRVLLDLSAGFERHWNGGDSFRTAFVNALSMSFPVGEQFFIDAVRAGVGQLPAQPQWDALRETVRGFVGQEATHRQIHGLFNAQLERQGLQNHWGPRAAARIEWGRALRLRLGSKKDYLHELAMTAAFEHFTAVFGDQTLAYVDQAGDWFAGAPTQLQTLWRWHAAEETEHKSVAFDLYRALGGNERWRIRWFLYVFGVFSWDAARQTCHNLWRDGTWYWPSTWWSALSFFWGRHGAVWRCAKPMAQYLRRSFHPSQVGRGELATAWLAANRTSYRIVGA